jgi:hypothetical protein
MAADVDIARRWGPKLRSTCTPALPRTPAGWGCTGSRLASAHRELPDRDRHGVNFRTGAPLSPTERRARVLAVPRYLVPDLDWWLTTALTPARTGSPATRCSWPAPPGCASASWSTSNPPACTRSRPGGLAEVPLGKVAAGRMVPVDERTVVLIDWIFVHRSSGRPLPHPKTGRSTEFLLTHHGCSVSAYLLRDLTRVPETPDCPTPPHSCDIPTPLPCK